MSNLVSTDWLAAHRDDADLLILDATWHLPTLKRNARDEFVAAHIPSARFFDLDKTSDQNTTLPHMLPSAADFAFAMQQLGISSSTHVIAHDSYGLFSAARCWWMFKVFGHDKVSVLDGGLKKWRAENHPTSFGEPAPVMLGQFAATLNAAMIRNINEVATTSAQIADARSPHVFAAKSPNRAPG